jgi:hypothetical protein
MALRGRLRRLARMAERDMITFELEDGTIARFYENEHMECFLHECARGRRHYFGEDPGPAHPMVEALRKVSKEELARIMSEHGTILGQLVGEDQIIRGEGASRAAGSGDLSRGVRMNLKRRLERLETEGGADETPWWTLPPGEEPDWPRPLEHWSDEELEEMSHRDIEEYCDALDSEAGREYHSSYEEVWLRQEVFHELRWRKYGIARRSQGMPPPAKLGWDVDEQENDERKDR